MRLDLQRSLPQNDPPNAEIKQSSLYPSALITRFGSADSSSIVSSEQVTEHAKHHESL
jgi:hypothetical protein